MISPNPASGTINVSMNSDGESEIRIEVLDITGNYTGIGNVYHTTGILNTSINVSDLAAGTYIIKVINNGKVTGKSFIKL